jgi:hypothetical protein
LLEKGSIIFIAEWHLIEIIEGVTTRERCTRETGSVASVVQLSQSYPSSQIPRDWNNFFAVIVTGRRGNSIVDN